MIKTDSSHPSYFITFIVNACIQYPTILVASQPQNIINKTSLESRMLPHLKLCNQSVIKERRRICHFFCWEMFPNDAYSGDASSFLITIWSVWILDSDFADCDGHGAAYSWSLEDRGGDIPRRSFSLAFSSATICNFALSSSLLTLRSSFCNWRSIDNLVGF